jgi:ubiquinone/menaquinone biosynthesis C-methylase UbiE
VSSPDLDPDELRAASHDRWERAAEGWQRRQSVVRAFSAPVSLWMVEAIRPQPGHRVLELAAGLGETGFLTAELIRPGGRLICSDRSEGMLAAARGRAAELGLDNVEFQCVDAEWIDLPLASLDAVLCRWGYMLMVDPAAALRESRRVLRPGGRVALAVWDAPERNPWTTVLRDELLARGWTKPPAPGAPGMFSLADPAALTTLLVEAGFAEVVIEPLAFEQRYADARAWLDIQLDLSRPAAEAMTDRSEDERRTLEAALAEQLSPHSEEDGELILPASALMAAASA